MGRERTRTWKHIYLSLTLLMFFLVIGCSLLEEIRIKIRGEPYQSLLQGQRLLAEGDYEGALWVAIFGEGRVYRIDL